MVKKIVATLVFSLSILPAQTVFAAELDYDLIDNLARTESVEFSADLDFETTNDQLDSPVSIHLDIDGASDMLNGQAKFDLSFSSTDQYGKQVQSGGSAIVTPDKLYISEDGDVWYFIEQSGVELNSEATDEDINAVKDVLRDMFEHGVIDYESEGVRMLNRKMMVRYAYNINNERLVDYLVEKDLISEDQVEKVRETLNDVTVGGKFWVDPVKLLPTKFTLDMKVIPNETSYTNIQVSIFFESFNDEVDIDIPSNATDIRDLDSDEFNAAANSISNSVDVIDADGDGLTNEEELETWKSNPYSTDSDGDGYPDYTEVVNGYNPNGIGKLDSDRDGLTDYNEMTIHWTDRFDADSDGDGYNDGLEIANGYNPNGPGRW